MKTSTSHVFGGVTYHMPDGLKISYLGTYVPVSSAATSNCTSPVTIDQHYPLYATEDCAKRASPRNEAKEFQFSSDASSGGSRRRRARVTDDKLNKRIKEERRMKDSRPSTSQVHDQHFRRSTSARKSEKKKKERFLDDNVKYYYMPLDVPTWEGDYAPML